MKKLFTKSFLLFLLIGLSFSSCKKDSDETTTPTTGGEGTVTVERLGIGAQPYSKFSSIAAGITQVTAAGATVFTVSAIKTGSNESLTILINQKITTAPTTIDLSYNNANGSGITYSKDYTKPADVALNYKTTNYGSYGKGGGQVKITKLDGNKVEGTFIFSAYNNAGESAWAENGTFSGTIK